MEIETRTGRVMGAREADVLAFRGLPYARAPLGPRRFRAPEPLEPWVGSLRADRFAAAAPQLPGMIGSMLGEATRDTSEDCLYLNVWTPAADSAARPVMVWIHGGAFVTGSGCQSIYSGAALAKRGDVVVVTLNYRLGALGFLDAPGLGIPDSVANAGLHDQIAALEWIRANIRELGGDPARVTIFGESAGAMSVSALLAIPQASGLFRRAILQSGALHYPRSRESALSVGRALLDSLSVPHERPEQLRELPIEALMRAQQALLSRPPPGTAGLPFQPFVDGELLDAPPLERVRSGAAGGVSILSGTNLDEFRLFGLRDPNARRLDLEALLRRVAHTLEGRTADPWQAAARLVEQYHAAREGRAPASPKDLWFAIESDRFFRVPSIRLAEAQSTHAPATFKYLFTWASPALRGQLGSCHALEIPFVFGTYGAPALRRFVGHCDRVSSLSREIQDAWTAFARTGDPAHPGLDAWPAYAEPERATMLFGAETTLALDPFGDERRAWEGLA